MTGGLLIAVDVRNAAFMISHHSATAKGLQP